VAGTAQLTPVEQLVGVLRRAAVRGMRPTSSTDRVCSTISCFSSASSNAAAQNLRVMPWSQTTLLHRLTPRSKLEAGFHPFSWDWRVPSSPAGSGSVSGEPQIG